MVTEISSLETLEEYINDPDKLTVIDFTATQCPPCQAIKPIFEGLSKVNTHANFIKVDVDKAQEIVRSYSITTMPTFVFMKGSEVVHRVIGANPGGLKSAVAQFGESASSA